MFRLGVNCVSGLFTQSFCFPKTVSRWADKIFYLTWAIYSKWAVVVSVACCLSSTIASKDISSCIIGWTLTKLDRDDPYMAFINLIFKWFYSILYMYLAQMG